MEELCELITERTNNINKIVKENISAEQFKLIKETEKARADK